jgi:hypothetical protein
MTIGLDEGITRRGGIVPVREAGKPGRKRGSKNKVTILKLIAEEAVRTNNAAKIMEVCNLIVDQALEGDKTSQKLVWQSVVSNGISEDKVVAEKVEIRIGAMEAPKEVIINPTELEDITDE